MLLLLLAALLSVQPPQDVASGPLRGATEGTGASQEDWFTRALHYMESNPETLKELMTKNYAVLEGDMVLASDRNAVESMWPTQEIPYVISPALASRTDDILSAMAMLSEHTCVSFHKRTSETNYLLFVKSRGCASYVGFNGGEQPVFVGHLCAVGNVLHEILHALGFHHEHTRADREQYITVLPHNIMDGMERNFKKQEGKTFDLRYDVTSIMHYGSGFFSVNGLPTIVANSDMEDMGQRVKMTETDIERVRLLYGCGTLWCSVVLCDAGRNATEKGSSDVKEADDVNDVASTVRTKTPEEDQSSAAPSLQLLNATTRGHNDTIRDQAQTHRCINKT
ncbi:hatching enzyme 1.2 isoform X2 [Sebastes fasciatus]|uniref:hatching enzyme 1.2 isoform X2 n=1 Tax=Sebastes fasciatus TaxID=394691 RepID=UPI003D9F5C47